MMLSAHATLAVALVTVLALAVYLWVSNAVGSARGKYKIAAPAMTGHPDFERAVRQREAEKWAKGFSCWHQFVAMLFCRTPPSTFHCAPEVFAPAGRIVTCTLPVCAWQRAVISISPPTHSTIIFFMATALLRQRPRWRRPPEKSVRHRPGVLPEEDAFDFVASVSGHDADYNRGHRIMG